VRQVEVTVKWKAESGLIHQVADQRFLFLEFRDRLIDLIAAEFVDLFPD
jgi:hypothetical protein